MEKVFGVIRLLFLFGMLCGVYFETGAFTTILIALIIARSEDIIEAINIEALNVSIISRFLNSKYPEEFKIDYTEREKRID